MSEIQSTVQYRDIQGFPRYRVGDDGSVWSCKSKNGLATVPWHPLTQRPDKDGRMTVMLSNNGKQSLIRVHRLVLTAFVGPCPEGMECCHFPDKNPANNRLGNLRWDTKKANSADRAIHGTLLSGKRNHNAKLTDDKVRELRADYATGKFTQAEIGRKYGVSQCVAGLVIRRQRWQHVL